jgi:prophage regulatory protein
MTDDMPPGCGVGEPRLGGERDDNPRRCRSINHFPTRICKTWNYTHRCFERRCADGNMAGPCERIALHSNSKGNIPMQDTLTTPSIPEMGFIRQPQVLRIASFSATTLWRKCKSGDFPKPVRLSANISAWRVEDVRAWVGAHGGGCKQGTQQQAEQPRGKRGR